MKNNCLLDLIAAPFTPFNSDFSLNLDVVPQIAEHLVKQKVTGAFINGSTGEWASLSREERRSVAEAWRRATSKDLKLIVHVGHNCLADSEDLARHAEGLGVHAIAAVMPSYFRPNTVKEAVDFCRRIAEAAPSTPFYYYHIPNMTGVNLKMVEFLHAACQSIKTFRGIKFTHSDLMDYSLTLADAKGKYDIRFGRDEYLLAALALGAKGAVGSTYNYSARLYHKMIQAYATGENEEARQLQFYIQRTILPLHKYGGIEVGKAVMALVGVDCGPVRPPLRNLVGEKLDAVKAELHSLDFFSKVRI